MTKNPEHFADDPTAFYDSARVLTLAGIPWPSLEAMESAGAFPARVTSAPGDVWYRADVDACLKDHQP